MQDTTLRLSGTTGTRSRWEAVTIVAYFASSSSGSVKPQWRGKWGSTLGPERSGDPLNSCYVIRLSELTAEAPCYNTT